MVAKNNKEHNNNYNLYRHHAWAGLGLLSVFLALRYVINIPQLLTFAVVISLSCYITIALIATYRYRKYLKDNTQIIENKIIAQKNSNEFIEKQHNKIEKKREKAKLKTTKKTYKY